jgi:diaminopimelate decarboxylase
MEFFTYRGEHLYVEDIPLQKIAAEHATPCYVYSKSALEQHWNAFDQAFAGHPHLICYAVKACSNLAILNVLAGLGSGFDIVSRGELERVLAAGGDPEKIVFSGVGKSEDDITAALKVGIRCFNVEVSGEMDRINKLAGDLGCIAPVSIRVNPDVDANTHPYISTGLKENKFGIDIHAAQAEYLRAAELPNIKIIGIDCHIGSQLTETAPFIDALEKVLQLLVELKQAGIDVHHLDLGGGLGIRYQHEQPPEPAAYVRTILKKLGGMNYEILLEPGRAIVGNAGLLITKVEYLKPTPGKNFAIVDAAMNDLLRPALYSAWQNIIPVNKGAGECQAIWDIVGPVCETGDFLGKERNLKLSPGDFLAVCSSGAYGFAMSSNYNSRPRAAEVMVDGEQIHLIRARESVADLWRGEKLLSE